MPIGKAVRRALGPFEDRAADAYRRYFIDLDDLAEKLKALPYPASILEIGAGDGMVATRLSRLWPTASYLGVDLCDPVGCLYDGRPGWPTFRQVDASTLEPSTFDLVVIVDVLHHVSVVGWPAFMDMAWSLVARSGHLALKDWTPSPTIAHALCYAADRFVTGDRVHHATRPMLLDLLGKEGTSTHCETTIAPHDNNLLLIAGRERSMPADGGGDVR